MKKKEDDKKIIVFYELINTFEQFFQYTNENINISSEFLDYLTKIEQETGYSLKIYGLTDITLDENVGWGIKKNNYRIKKEHKVITNTLNNDSVYTYLIKKLDFLDKQQNYNEIINLISGESAFINFLILKKNEIQTDKIKTQVQNIFFNILKNETLDTKTKFEYLDKMNLIIKILDMEKDIEKAIEKDENIKNISNSKIELKDIPNEDYRYWFFKIKDKEQIKEFIKDQIILSFDKSFKIQDKKFEIFFSGLNEDERKFEKFAKSFISSLKQEEIQNFIEDITTKKPEMKDYQKHLRTEFNKISRAKELYEAKNNYKKQRMELCAYIQMNIKIISTMQQNNEDDKDITEKFNTRISELKSMIPEKRNENINIKIYDKEKEKLNKLKKIEELFNLSYEYKKMIDEQLESKDKPLTKKNKKFRRRKRKMYR